jgi:hypothetical protein
MILGRRSLLEYAAVLSIPVLSRCAGFRTTQGDKPAATQSSARGASDVSVHNLHDESISVSIRVENVDENRNQEEKIPVDKTVTLESAATHKINNRTRFGSEYAVSVSLESGYAEEANWTPDSGGGLHVIYDGSNNLVFADEFA